MLPVPWTRQPPAGQFTVHVAPAAQVKLQAWSHWCAHVLSHEHELPLHEA